MRIRCISMGSGTPDRAFVRAEDGTSRTEAIHAISIGTLYKPLEIAITTAANGEIRRLYLLRSDANKYAHLNLAYHEARHFEVLEADLGLDWEILYQDNRHFKIGDPAVKDIETIHDRLLAKDPATVELIRRKTEV